MRLRVFAVAAGFPLIALLLACGAPAAPPEPIDAARSVARYSIEDLYANTDYRGVSFSPDAQRVLVLSNQTGVFNVFSLPAGGGVPRQLTSSTSDAILGAVHFPADDRFLFWHDRGGNELTHVYVQAPDGRVTDLTPGDELKASFHGWSGDDRSFFIATNERDPTAFDLYELTTDGYTRTLFYRNADRYQLGPVSRDKRYLALLKPRTSNDSDLFLHDRRTGTTAHISRHSGNVNYLPVDFTPDGKSLLFVSDEDNEFAALRRYDIAAAAPSLVYEQAWDILGAGFTRTGRHLIVTVNEDSRITQRVLDAGTMRPIPLGDLPGGVIREMRLSPGDETIAFYASDGSSPYELYAGPLGGPVERITSALNAKIRRDDLVAPTVVRFNSYDGVVIPGLLYKPHQASGRSPAPALVMVHGGPGGQAVVGYRALVQALVNHGYVVFDINNRGSSGYGKTFYAMDDRRHGEADLGDVVASKQMLIDTGFVDADRIGIIGGSYGGYMVLAALTLQPDEFKVGIDLFGISNWVRTMNNIPAWWGATRDALFDEMGDPKADAARLHRISPLFSAHRIKVPLMVLQGANDPRVLQVESDEIVAAALKNGVPVEYIVFPDEGHGFRRKENEIRGYGAVLDFLEKHLQGNLVIG